MRSNPGCRLQERPGRASRHNHTNSQPRLASPNACLLPQQPGPWQRWKIWWKKIWNDRQGLGPREAARGPTDPPPQRSACSRGALAIPRARLLPRTRVGALPSGFAPVPVARRSRGATPAALPSWSLVASVVVVAGLVRQAASQPVIVGFASSFVLMPAGMICPYALVGAACRGVCLRAVLPSFLACSCF